MDGLESTAWGALAGAVVVALKEIVVAIIQHRKETKEHARTTGSGVWIFSVQEREEIEEIAIHKDVGLAMLINHKLELKPGQTEIERDDIRSSFRP